MLDFLVCHAPADRGIAERIAGCLSLAGAEVWLDQAGSSADDNVAIGWEGGQSYAAILLVLSPDSTPPVAGRAAWHTVLDHRERHAHPPMAIVLARPCAYPRVLERRDFFRWGDDARQTLRAIGRWAMALCEAPDPPFFEPAPLPWFEGCEAELAVLWDALVDTSGMAMIVGPAGTGKTALAQEFATRASAHFRGIVWVACGDRSGASILAEFGMQLGVTGCEDATCVATLLREHRVLLVLDDATPETPLPELAGGRASVVVTSRDATLKSGQQALMIPMSCCRLFEAIVRPSGPDEMSLWNAMAACRPHDISLQLAGEIAGLGTERTQSACERLVASRLVDPLDRGGSRLRLNARSAAAAVEGISTETLRSRQADSLRLVFRRWTKERDRCRLLMPEVEAALRWAVVADWEIASDLGLQAAAFLGREGRAAEAARILRFLRDSAEDRADDGLVRTCAWQLSWMDGTLSDGSLRVGEQLQLEF